MHNINKTSYCPPEAEVLTIRMESAMLTISNPDFKEDDSDDDFFDDGN